MEFVTAHRDEHGVDPICAALRGSAAQIARPPYGPIWALDVSKRHEQFVTADNREMLGEIRTVHARQPRCPGYSQGPRRTTQKGVRRGPPHRRTIDESRWIARDTAVETRKTTRNEVAETPQPADRVKQQFAAEAPSILWVADLTYIRTHSGWVYAALMLDVYSRMVVGR